MRIKNLYLENFNNLKKVNLNLDHDINLILGDNGSGKSSCVEALSAISRASPDVTVT